jgi:hypothetical protein
MELRLRHAVEVVAARLARSARARSSGSLLVAMSGIDGSGKGYTATLLQRALEQRDIRTALVHADDWLSPPRERFGDPPTARHFYEHGFLFDRMFATLVTPLRRRGRIKGPGRGNMRPMAAAPTFETSRARLVPSSGLALFPALAIGFVSHSDSDETSPDRVISR